MEGSGLGGGFLSGSSGGLIDLESPIHGLQTTHSARPSLHPFNIMSSPEDGQNFIRLMEINGQTCKSLSANLNKGKAVVSVNAMNNYTSEEDEPSYTEDGNGENIEGVKCSRGSQWQRMKWTDDVIRLLIAVVAHVGDDGEGREGLKRKSGILQKKGKWKMVSKIMISKGCYVSPQQCEDKFNDLNKRYKRLNDILGRGTSCRVVENPSLMDSMPHISAKAKDVVKKILSSKHLFYKEMCAYHNGLKIPDFHDLDLQNFSLPDGGRCRESNNSEKEAVENDSDDDESDDENVRLHDQARGRMVEYGQREAATREDGHTLQHRIGQESFALEMAGIFDDPATSLWERKEWIKKQMFQLQEQRVTIQVQALELEKQRFKWLRYCSKKDRELERLKLENERMRLENEQGILQLKKKDLQFEFKASDASIDPTSQVFDNLCAREQRGGRDLRISHYGLQSAGPQMSKCTAHQPPDRRPRGRA